MVSSVKTILYMYIANINKETAYRFGEISKFELIYLKSLPT